MAVMRFEPFADSGIDRLFERIVGGAGMSHSTSVPMDVYRRGNEDIVEMELPGVAEDDIDVRIERNALSVTAERIFLADTFGSSSRLISPASVAADLLILAVGSCRS